jgi:hypothetical protein
MQGTPATDLLSTDAAAPPSARGAGVAVLVLSAIAASLAVAAVWLWAGHGGAVFFDMVVTGLRNCF